MPYDETSPEAVVGELAERLVVNRLKRYGEIILRLSSIGDGPALFECPEGRLISLDILSAKDGITRFWEVKFKSGPVYFRKLHVLRTGVSARQWRHYLEIERRCGLAGMLAMIHLTMFRGEIEEVRKTGLYQRHLLVATLKHLRARLEIGTMHVGDFGDGEESVNWDLGDFT